MTATVEQPHVRSKITVDMIRHGLVWLGFALSFLVFLEPAPSDYVFLLTIILFSVSGLSFTAALGPLVVMLVLFMIGGFTSLMLVYNQSDSVKYVFVSLYMVAMAIFYAAYIVPSPLKRLNLITHGWIAGAFIASVLGIVGALDIAGTGAYMSLQGRAQGLFKDPNVYSTYIIFPALMLMQWMLLGDLQKRVLSLLILLVILAGLFLAFSRGAWLNFMLGAALMVAATFVLSNSVAQRTRIMLLVSIGVMAALVIIAGLLTIENVRNLFLDRFTLTKDYDSGETGRFGNQLISIPVLMTSPLGVGPINYRNVFYFDPHNVYLNGFASYGWLGGFSYLFLVLTVVTVGIRSMLVFSSIQPYAIVATCVFFSTAVQGIQIDTDHWRHFYWITGLVWGLYAATPRRTAPDQVAFK
jgi:hypothetical protein